MLIVHLVLAEILWNVCRVVVSRLHCFVARVNDFVNCTRRFALVALNIELLTTSSAFGLRVRAEFALRKRLFDWLRVVRRLSIVKIVSIVVDDVLEEVLVVEQLRVLLGRLAEVSIDLIVAGR